jgi:hypothetical protein
MTAMAATIRNSTSNRWLVFPAVAAGAALLATAGHAAQQKSPEPSSTAEPAQSRSKTSKDAQDIVSQPAKDVGAQKTKIPPLLIEVSRNPYGTRGTATCGQISAAIADLNLVLGPDFSASPPTPEKRNLGKAGGQAVVNSLIPLRGLVREVSGAGPAERRLAAAVDAGIARRGFLHGLQRGRGCRTAS